MHPIVKPLHQCENVQRYNEFIHYKGTVSKDFRLLVFFMNQFPPSIWVYQYGLFEFFRKFAEIFAAPAAIAAKFRCCALGRTTSGAELPDRTVAGSFMKGKTSGNGRGLRGDAECGWFCGQLGDGRLTGCGRRRTLREGGGKIYKSFLPGGDIPPDWTPL